MLASDDVVRPGVGGAGVLLTALRPTVQVAITLACAQTRRSASSRRQVPTDAIVEIDGRPAASVDEWSDGALG